MFPARLCRRLARALRFEPLEPRMLLAADPQYVVNHTPYLQLGDAPLAGYAGSASDQVEVLWQTRSAGSGTEDSFVVEYRRAGDAAWSPAGPEQTLDTLVDTRIVHSVELAGLAFDTDYQYRVQHLRAGAPIGTYQNTFHTRLPAADSAPFSFVAYGDSANTATLQDFRSVQGRINQLDPEFALLLGDLAYPNTSHADFDARFDPALDPEATQWNAGHIDYAAFGNHELLTANGKPTEDNYSSPIPVGGVTAPASPPASETVEHNYSFDYGGVHFVTFDTNSLHDAGRLDGQLQWVEADLRASHAPWKIVFGHHPVAGGPEKPESVKGNYYQQVVSRLRAAGADLFLVGHSHTASRSYPLLGRQNDQATFVLDTDNEYARGAGLVQVVMGVGGGSLRDGSFATFPFLAKAFSTATDPPSQFGFAKIDVTPTELTVSYIAAGDGSVLDQFFIDAVQPLGPVTFQELPAQDPSARDLWYRVTTTHDGLLTAEAAFPGAGGSVGLKLYDANSSELAASTLVGGRQRIDWQTGAGQTYLVQLSGSNSQVDLRLANLVQFSSDGTEITVYDSPGNDTLSASLRAPMSLAIDGIRYQSATATTIRAIGGAGGGGVAKLYDSPGSDTFVARPRYVELSGGGRSLVVEQFGAVHAYASSGGDKAQFYDSSGNDAFYASPVEASLYGSGFYNRAKGFQSVEGFATAGGDDTANLYDSAGNDTFAAGPGGAIFSGPGFSNRAVGFKSVNAYAGTGADVAKLYDSPGKDEFVAGPFGAAMYSPGYTTRATGFDGVHAYSTAGGADVAKLYDSRGNDSFYASPSEASLYGPGFYNRAKSFEAVHAYATAGGRDVANLYDSTGDDTFYADASQAALWGAGFYNRAKFFEEVYGNATAGGIDQADLHDSALADLLEADGNWARLSNATLNLLYDAVAFDRVKATATTSGDKKTVKSPLEFLLELAGPWEDA